MVEAVDTLERAADRQQGTGTGHLAAACTLTMRVTQRNGFAGERGGYRGRCAAVVVEEVLVVDSVAAGRCHTAAVVVGEVLAVGFVAVDRYHTAAGVEAAVANPFGRAGKSACYLSATRIHPSPVPVGCRS